MTTEDRIAIIKNKANNDRQKEIDKENALFEKTEKLKKEITSLGDRIKEVIYLANVCRNNGVEIPQNKPMSFKYNSAEKYGYDAEFIAEGIRHHVGFDRRNYNIKYLSIINGGACGSLDFYTDGVRIFSRSNRDYENYRDGEPRIQDMQKFLREFPIFEQAFYNWINSLQ